MRRSTRNRVAGSHHCWLSRPPARSPSPAAAAAAPRTLQAPEAAPASGGPCGTTADTTLTVGLFGTFGFKEAGLWDAYKKVCPNITIKEDDVEQSADYWTRLKTRLASSSGLDDVQAIEIGFVADVVQNHTDQFVNWNTVPNSAADKAEFYPWKWGQASTNDGKTTVGLGTDIGPEAICYRSDLLKEAGLPSDPKTLATKWTTWDDFINFGKQYEASKTKPSGSHFVDSAASIFSTAVYQGGEAYDNANGETDVENSDGVKNAWQLRHAGGPGRHHRRAPAVPDPRGTRPSPAARSRRWPARPG